MENLSLSELEQILSQRLIVSHYQPIISVKQKRTIGLEALSRGINPSDQSMVPPPVLFQAAEKFNKIVEVDRLCRDKALENFAQLHKSNPDLLLFVNFDTSMVDKGIVGSGNFLQAVRRYGINPRNIVIELVESRVNELSELISFISMYREQGLLIALDDFGAGHSNLERISHIKPNIIKIDRTLICNVQNEFYKQEILRASIKMANQLGVMVLSEGVETRQEVFKTLELDTDLLQGFYFSRPSVLENISFAQTDHLIRETASEYFNQAISRIKTENERFRNFQNLSFAMLSVLKSSLARETEDEIRNMISSYSIIECAFVLDSSGRQTTSTLLNNGYLSKRRGNSLFKPAQCGDDHSLKDYYVYIRAGLNKFITAPYISLATGSLCRTIAMTYCAADKKRYILCLDIRENA